MKALNKIFGKKNKNHPWDKFYKKNERTIEVPNVSLYEYLKECNENNMNSIAINYFNKKITFQQFFDEIDICAKALRSQGIRPGDVVTICMANTPEAVIAFYAINKIGAISNMIHPLSAEQEIKNSLISTKSVMLIAINLSYEKIKEIIDTKSSFADWLNNQIVRDQLKFDIKVCLIKNGYPPQYSPEVFRKVMEQVENFEENQ